MANRRTRGLCYNCDEMYSASYQYKKLFWLEIDDSGLENDNLNNETEVEPTISLHAITGFQHSRTMQVVA
uniref:Uncharacterized protein n=1 Tax=Manihot esculenta TaxID=3983 RepID=A0A2C9W2A7_MANES